MDDKRHKTPSDQVPARLLGLGAVLIVCGVVIAFYVARETLRLYQQTGDNPFINALISQFKDTDLLLFAGHPLAITEQGATIVAFAFFILLALLGIHIAVALIRAGTHILSPTFPRQFARLKLQIANLRDKMDTK
jgi:divalent metal cation (Fe/Co/Zn/Cd) transporter